MSLTTVLVSVLVSICLICTAWYSLLIVNTEVKVFVVLVPPLPVFSDLDLDCTMASALDLNVAPDSVVAKVMVLE